MTSFKQLVTPVSGRFTDGFGPRGGDQLPGAMWGAGTPGRCHFQMGGVANGVLIVWSPPANTQYVSVKVSFLT